MWSASPTTAPTWRPVTSEGDDYDSHTLKSLMHHNPSKEYSLMYEECCKEYLTPLAAMEKEA